MSSERSSEAKRIAEATEDLPPTERAEWVKTACDGDELLQTEVESLLSERDIDLPSTQTAVCGEAMTGRRIGPWCLQHELGQGGMGSVWFAVRADQEFRRQVAIKLIRESRATPDMADRFRRERQILADLKHPHIAVLYDGGTTLEGEPYFVMEYVDGENMDRYCENRSLPMTKRIQLFIKICEAIGYAHSKGIIHRDIKPSNMMIDEAGEPKLLDFGIARLAEEQTTVLTKTGANPLTPEYAAPEQLRGITATKYSDIYSLGLVLYRIISGQMPSQLGPEPAKTLRYAQGTDTFPMPELVPILIRALDLEPKRRYPDSQEFAADLKKLLEGKPISVTQVGMGAREFDAMLWYHPLDCKTVTQMAFRLEEECRLKVWFDEWHKVTGETGEEALIRGLTSSGCLVVVLGANGHAPWRDATNRQVLEKHFRSGRERVVPLLLPGARLPVRESALPAFLRRRTWAILEEKGEQTVLAPLEKAIRGQAPGKPAPKYEPEICPFRGLESYREQDRPYFFGREAITQRLADHVDRHRFLAVLGPSGSGKSSVVQAGLMPTLRDTGSLITLFTPSVRPTEELAFALNGLFPETAHAPPGEQIRSRLMASTEALHFLAKEVCAATRCKRVYLVIDQFEELFTMSKDSEEITRFLTSLLFAVEQQGGTLSVVLTMRSDFIGKVVKWPDFDSYMTEHCIQIGPMDREQLAQAITEPARLAGLSFEEGLLERVMKDVEGAPGELPLLSHALLELFSRKKAGVLTLAAYVAIGGIEGALAQRAETEFNQLDARAQDTLRKMFTLCLIQPGEGTHDTRRRATRAELLAIGSRPDLAEDLLTRLTGARLLTGYRDAHRQLDVVEVAHEALIARWQRVGTWMEEDRETARYLNRLRRRAKTWDEAGRNEDYLLRGTPLQQMIELTKREDTHVAPLERAYVEAGTQALTREKRDVEQRRRRVLFLSWAVAGITFLGLLVAAFLLVRLNEERKLAKANELKAIAEAETVREASNFLTGLFAFSESERALNREITAKELLDRGTENLERQLQNQPRTQARFFEFMGGVYRQLGLYKQAADLMKKALTGKTELLGADHLEVLTIKDQLADILRADGAFEEAQQMAQETLDKRRSQADAEPLDIASSLAVLARVLAKRGEFQKAEPLFRDALEVTRNSLGVDDPAVAAAQNDLASVLEALGIYEEAETLLRQSLAIYTSLPEEKLQTAKTLNELAHLLGEIGDYKGAEALYRESLAKSRELFGENHPDVAVGLNNLALTLENQGAYSEAEPLYQKSLAVNRKLLGDNHPNLAANMSNLGLLRQSMGKLDEAEPLFREALAIDRKTFQGDHPFVGLSLNNLADLLALKEQFQEAETHMTEALNIYQKTIPPGHWRVTVGHSIHGRILAGLGRFQDAEPMLLQAHKSLADAKGCNDRYTRDAKKRVIHAFQMAGKKAEAERLQLELCPKQSP